MTDEDVEVFKRNAERVKDWEDKCGMFLYLAVAEASNRVSTDDVAKLLGSLKACKEYDKWLNDAFEKPNKEIFWLEPWFEE